VFLRSGMIGVVDAFDACASALCISWLLLRFLVCPDSRGLIARLAFVTYLNYLLYCVLPLMLLHSLICCYSLDGLARRFHGFHSCFK
jgi:hypothetical protein